MEHFSTAVTMTNKLQLCGTIYCPLIAPHVSSDTFTHHQALLKCIFTTSGNKYVRYHLPVLRENRNCSDSPTTLAGSNVRMYYHKL